MISEKYEIILIENNGMRNTYLDKLGCKVFYTNNLDVNIVYEFEGVIAKYIVENLKICKYKPLGYVFNTDINHNIIIYIYIKYIKYRIYIDIVNTL